MTELVTNARREGTGELLLTAGLLVLYVGLRGTARALGALGGGEKPSRTG